MSSIVYINFDKLKSLSIEKYEGNDNDNNKYNKNVGKWTESKTLMKMIIFLNRARDRDRESFNILYDSSLNTGSSVRTASDSIQVYTPSSVQISPFK